MNSRQAKITKRNLKPAGPRHVHYFLAGGVCRCGRLMEVSNGQSR